MHTFPGPSDHYYSGCQEWIQCSANLTVNVQIWTDISFPQPNFQSAWFPLSCMTGECYIYTHTFEHNN